ncbi:MAG: phosphoribosylformylglycinamidine synthase subunit PurL [Dehalococcoidia bacterium]
MRFDEQTLKNLSLTQYEYDLLVEKLGREPNYIELGLFGSLWSEHCGYQHSKPLLKRFQSDHPKLLVSAGEENAGVVDIGDGDAIVFKIESHNHPSAIEPYEGAATGVGGIVRDIFAMGARPVALLNSLRFGPLDVDRNKYLLEGVVSGISNYGNCLGIPNIGGEINFSDSYTGNPLVNAMCIGVLKIEELIKSSSGPADNLLLLVGSGTGRDGIHGASGLASNTFDEDQELRPTVQVGNPFLEKILIESCLEAVSSGKVDGLQDLGAAGLTSASVECAANGNMGFEIDVSLIPRRESGLEAYEVMLSETQERMLFSISPENLDYVSSIFKKWDINHNVIGKVTKREYATILESGELIADVPINILTDPPLYTLDGIESLEISEARQTSLKNIPIPQESQMTIFLKLLSSENIASREYVYRQYDHQVQTNTVIPPGGDASLIRIKGTKKALAASTDGNSRISYLDPYIGAQIAVAEACRNISCTGAEPIALTNCLNFGNPQKPEVYYQLDKCVSGISDMSLQFNAPVISGNVSLYNETQVSAIFPTPVIGAVGLLQNVENHCQSAFKNENDLVFLLGTNQIDLSLEYFAGSEFLELIHNKIEGAPEIDVNLEVILQKTCRELISLNLLNSCHDCSEGGLAIAIAESAILGNKGFIANFELNERWDSALFGEKQSRVVISFHSSKLNEIITICNRFSLPFLDLGKVSSNRFKVSEFIDTDVDEISNVWKDTFLKELD